MGETAANRLIAQRMATPDQRMLQRIRAVSWTGHNIGLTPTESTMNPSDQPLVGNDPRTTAIRNNMRMIVGRQGDLAGLRLIDIGCLEGGISLAMAREDIHVVGLEGRRSNYEKCLLIRDFFGLPNLEFLHLDAKELNRADYGVFDVVLCLGLLYHLDDPIGFLGRINEITHDKSMLFLDTHIAPRDSASLEGCMYRDLLSDIVSFDRTGTTYEGRWYREYPEGDAGAGNEWSSISNTRSFWLTEESLIRALSHAGFRFVYNLYGNFGIEEEFDLRKKYSRLWCIALKEGFHERPQAARESPQPPI